MRRSPSAVLTGAVAAVALVGAACGGENTDSASTSPASASTDSAEVPVSESTSGAVSPATTAAPATTTTVAPSALAQEFDLPTLAILSAAAGGGDRPDLAWEPVDGAAEYRVTALDPSGVFYWGWDGETTEVPFGGLPRLEPAAAGPRVVPGMTWTVLALDAAGIPLAAGGPVPLSP